ncbi:MAG: FtsW/RodA/SpoVE family cell cycle protein [Alphaproteobacteria bacterium]|nr:FtsW/RodA/SpoVE family cell cycle protein [Alphaproteobacteria bacterium]
MVRISRGEDSKFTSWFFEIDRTILYCIFGFIFIGIISLITSGSAQAARMGPDYPWYHFFIKMFPFYIMGIVSLICCSILNKKQIIFFSTLILIAAIPLLVWTLFLPQINGSSRWVSLFNISITPSEMLKPALIMLSAWFLSKMNTIYGENIFENKETCKFRFYSWWPYVFVYALVLFVLLKQPDVGSFVMFGGSAAAVLLVSGFPLKKWWHIVVLVLTAIGAVIFLTNDHIQNRTGTIFSIEPNSQIDFSLRCIRHGGLLGSADEGFVKDVLPESTNDFVFSSIAEDRGAIAACFLIFFIFFFFSKLIKRAIVAKSPFVLYAVTGTATLFAIQVSFNLMTALHILINKGTVLPFVSYGGSAFVAYCILFGMLLGVLREDTWNK